MIKIAKEAGQKCTLKASLLSKGWGTPQIIN